MNNTTDSIAAVTAIVQKKLETVLERDSISKEFKKVGIGYPNESQDGIYLSLNDVKIDSSLRNIPLKNGERPPVWLQLSYSITIYDKRNSADYNALKSLGRVIHALHSLDLLEYSDLPSWVEMALVDNPESLKLVIDESPIDTPTTKYKHLRDTLQYSIYFIIRPVMISSANPSFSALVETEYTQDERSG